MKSNQQLFPSLLLESNYLLINNKDNHKVINNDNDNCSIHYLPLISMQEKKTKKKQGVSRPASKSVSRIYPGRTCLKHDPNHELHGGVSPLSAQYDVDKMNSQSTPSPKLFQPLVFVVTFFRSLPKTCQSPIPSFDHS